MSRSARAVRETVHRIANVVLILIAGFVLLKPGGLLPSQLADWRDGREGRKLAAAHWAILAAAPSVVGSRTGEVRAVEFIDYRCTHCRGMHVEITDLLAMDPSVAVAIRHYPGLGDGPSARAARAAICAEEQGAFAPMNDRLFGRTSWDPEPPWGLIADSAGVPDLTRFGTCLTDSATTARLNEDIRLAQSLAIVGTPTFVHRRGIHAGAMPRRQLQGLLGVR